MSNTCQSIVADTFLTYTTVKVVKVPNTLIAVIFRLLQLVIIAYIAIFIVWYKRGYQEFQEPHGASVIKVKGVARVIDSDNATQMISATAGHLWDGPEYQLPPFEHNAFFIATRQIVTYEQKETQCASAVDDRLFCNSTDVATQCPEGHAANSSVGYYTGKCIPSPENETINVCEVYAWCPEESTLSKEYLVNQTDLRTFTVYLKTAVTFTLFNINLRNVRDNTVLPCRYDKNDDPHCPVLRIGDILDTLKTANPKLNVTALLHEGGLIEIRQDWTCNFDYDHNNCYPTWQFNVLQSGDDKQSPGVNYRSAQKYRENDTEYRTLSKIFGLRFVITITGKGGQFNIVNLFVAIGSGIGFMVIAGVICDAIFMYIHSSRERYREGKFSVCEVNPDEAYLKQSTNPTISFSNHRRAETDNA